MAVKLPRILRHLFGVSVIINCYTNTQSEFFEHEIKDTPM